MNQTLLVVLAVVALAAGGVFFWMNHSGDAMTANIDVSELEAQANDYVQNSEWENAITVYQEIVPADPNHSQAWFQMASSYRSLERWDEAAMAFEKAHELEFNPLFTSINLARMHGQLGNLDEAFKWINVTMDTGFGQVAFLQNDEQLEPLRGDDRFEAVLAVAQRNSTPCEFDENFRAFDFWIGEWDVTSGDGGPAAGTNSITKQPGGCMLYESWVGNGGSMGQSINYYDTVRGQWTQHWVDASGSHIELHGNLDENGAMVLVGSQTLMDGTVIPMRGTWTPLDDGRMRQFFEQSNDDGETWFTWFDGYYIRKESTE